MQVPYVISTNRVSRLSNHAERVLEAFMAASTGNVHTIRAIEEAFSLVNASYFCIKADYVRYLILRQNDDKLQRFQEEWRTEFKADSVLRALLSAQAVVYTHFFLRKIKGQDKQIEVQYNAENDANGCLKEVQRRNKTNIELLITERAQFVHSTATETSNENFMSTVKAMACLTSEEDVAGILTSLAATYLRKTGKANYSDLRRFLILHNAANCRYARTLPFFRDIMKASKFQPQMVGCTQGSAGEVVFVGASQNSARMNRTAVVLDRARRRAFAGDEYSDYDEYIQDILGRGEDDILSRMPPKFLMTRGNLTGVLWCVWRGNPELAGEDTENWEPMCKGYQPMRPVLTRIDARQSSRGSLTRFRD